MIVVDYYMYGINNDELDKEKVNYFYYVKLLIMVFILCNDFYIISDGKEVGDLIEVVLINYLSKNDLDYDKLRSKYIRINEILFDLDRKFMFIVNSIYGDYIMFIKGVLDIVFSRCKYVLKNGLKVDIIDEIIEEYKYKNEEFLNRVFRVLVFVIKDVLEEDFIFLIDDEYDMILVGIMVMIDLLREEVMDVVKEVKSVGIKIVMIIGDYKIIVVVIVKEIGIMEEGDLVFIGKEFDVLSEE